MGDYPDAFAVVVSQGAVRDYFCPGGINVRTAKEAVERLRRGAH